MDRQRMDNSICAPSRDIYCHSHLTHYLNHGRVQSLFTLHWPDIYQLLVTVTWTTGTTHCHVTMPPVAASFCAPCNLLGADVIENVAVTEIYRFCFSLRRPFVYLKVMLLFIWSDSDCASSLICGNKMPTRCNRWYLLQILLLAQHVSGNMPIIRSSRVLYRWLLPVVFGALVFKLSVWCGAEGYVLL